MKYLILFILSTQLAFAQDVSYLEKGSPAPYTGYLFSPQKEREIRLTTETLKYCDKSKEMALSILQDYETKDKITADRMNLRDQQIDSLSKRLVDAKDDSFLSKAGFFILGALVTGGIAYGLTRTLGK